MTHIHPMVFHDLLTKKPDNYEFLSQTQLFMAHINDKSSLKLGKRVNVKLVWIRTVQLRMNNDGIRLVEKSLLLNIRLVLSTGFISTTSELHSGD